MGNQYEQDYIALVNRVQSTGYLALSRAGETRSLPGQSLTVDLREGFPVLTTRKLYPAGVWGELAAFVRGAEDLATFKFFGCNYWDANAANWQPNMGTPESEWRVGKIYGAVWRNLNGVDQLANVIESLRTDPLSRRHVVSAWDGKCDGALPPCHVMFQFYVRQGELHCHVYMRSVDLCVGLPSDVLLYATLMHLVAKDVNLRPATLTFSFGDCHIYTAHLPDWQAQTTRQPLPLPLFELSPEAETLCFKPNEARLLGYVPHPPIKYEFMA